VKTSLDIGASSLGFEQIEKQVIGTLPLAQELAQNMGMPVPVCASVTCTKRDILNWLQNVQIFPRIYWSDRDGSFELGGCGESLRISENDPEKISKAIDTLERFNNLSPPLHFRFLGYLAFDLHHPMEERWSDFSALWFILPEIILSRNHDNYRVTANEIVRPDSSNHQVIESLLHKLDMALNVGCDSSLKLPIPVFGRRDLPDFHGWSVNITKALKQIAAKNINKVVLARRTDLTTNSQVKPFVLLKALKENSGRCFGFCIEPTRGSAFLGASPERLFKLKNNVLSSEAVSGTIKRGDSDFEDKSREDLLFSGKKYLREHNYVVQGLTLQFKKLCQTTNVTERLQLLKLTNIQHLITNISGNLKPGCPINHILSLHPTPAVGGFPGKAALQLIRTWEPFARGLYAGIFGLVSKECIDLSVAIRSMLIKDKTISLFSGAGIVEGSSPEDEWLEIESKILAAMKLFSEAT